MFDQVSELCFARNLKNTCTLKLHKNLIFISQCCFYPDLDDLKSLHHYLSVDVVKYGALNGMVIYWSFNIRFLGT